MSFKEKVVFITGSGSGIGRATAVSFGKEGASVIVNDIDEESARITRDEIVKQGGKAICVCGDITIRGNVIEMINEAISKYGGINILINNAGFFSPLDFFELDDDTWERTLSINLKGMFICSQLISKIMMENEYGRIINLSSILAKIPSKNNIHYCSAKAAVIQFTRVLALILSEYGITVNAVAPGPTYTDMLNKIIKVDPSMEEVLIYGDVKHFRVGIPLRRIAKPNDQASVIKFLASEDAGHITGQTIHVDGGESIF
jgi:3-oxoacyl-[acyl-carrier protein] reductase